MENKSSFVPPCGVNCEKCPKYKKGKNPCMGFEQGCKARQCKGIYVCCIEKQGLDYCHQCKSYPCARYKKFAESWLKLGDNLYKNQDYIKEHGAGEFINSSKE